MKAAFVPNVSAATGDMRQPPGLTFMGGSQIRRPRNLNRATLICLSSRSQVECIFVAVERV